MKKETVEVKAKGEVVDTIEVPQFENLQEAVQFFKEEPVVVALVNRQHKTDQTNAARAAKTRTKSPMAQLAKKAKEDPKVAEQLNALLAEYGIEA